MKLLRISDRYVNLERVTEFSFDAHGATISYDHDHSTQITARHEVVLLRRWLDAQALDLEVELAEHVEPEPILELESFLGAPIDDDSAETR